MKVRTMFRKNFTIMIASTSLLAMLFNAGCGSGSNGGNAPSDVALNTNIDSVSYGIGYLSGQNLSRQGMSDIELEKFLDGMEQALADQDAQIPQSEIQQILQAYQMEAQQKVQQQKMEEAEANKQEGEEFLAENRTKEGVQVTESGLQYKVLEEGSGDSPSPTDTVTVHYEGTLIDGTVFDSSYERGEPATFPLNRVIEGWTEGLQLMQEGATYRFYIPGDLAYGMNPRPGGQS